MGPTLLEGAIALLLVAIAIYIGFLLAPFIIRRFRGNGRRGGKDDDGKPPVTIDI
jgi:hypothetical protein